MNTTKFMNITDYSKLICNIYITLEIKELTKVSKPGARDCYGKVTKQKHVFLF